MIEVASRVTLDQVYHNSLHALSRLEIKNISEFHLIVKLRSNLNSQIAFQMSNENLPLAANRSSGISSDLSDAIIGTPLYTLGSDASVSITSSSSSLLESQYATPSADVIPQTTNTVEAAMNLIGNNHHHEFNQLFNFVNYIDQVEIEPGQTSKIIIAFLPDDREGTLAGSAMDGDVLKSDGFLYKGPNDLLASGEETFNYSEVNGVLFFVCFIKPSSMLKTTMSNSSSNGYDTPKSAALKLKLVEQKGISESGFTALETPSMPDYQATCKFRSRVCKSVLTTDISSTGLIFDDCIAGGTYFKDFSVSNRSEIELFWILNTVDLSNHDGKNVLKFTDYDTGEPLDFSPIPAYSPKRIRVSFKPKEIGEFNYDLQIENQNDARNTIQTRIHAVVRSVLREEKLVISTGNMLDFGDCITGKWKKKFIAVRNVSDTPIEVTFKSDNPTEIVFQLRNDDLVAASMAGGLNVQRTRKLSQHSHKRSDSNPIKEISQFADQLSGMSRQHSEMSLSRSHSSADSDPLINLEDDKQPDIDFQPDSILDRELIPGKEEKMHFSSFDIQLRDTIQTGDEIARIEELLIRPGSEKIIDVCYFPAKDLITPDYRACKLTQRNFRLFLSHFTPGKQHHSEKSTIQCVSRTCTSAIEVSPAVIQFGDTDVGMLKSASIVIKNCAELPAFVEIRMISKVLSSIRGELHVPAKQSIEAKIDIYPRKVNPDYRKEVIIANLLNSENDQTIEVRSTNIDQQRITFHSLYYNIHTPLSSHLLDFGTAIANSPVVRSLSIENISEGDLLLHIASSISSDLSIYTKADNYDVNNGSNVRPIERKEKLLESIEVRRRMKRPAGLDLPQGRGGINTPKSLSTFGLNHPLRTITAATSIGEHSPDYLDLASAILVPKRHTSTKRALETRDKSVGRFSTANSEEMFNSDYIADGDTAEVIDFISRLEKETGAPPPHFSKASAEERYVKVHQSLRRELQEFIADGQLIPISEMRIPPQGQKTIVLIMKISPNSHTYNSDKARKIDSKIFIKMLEFDRNVKHPQFEQLAKEETIPIRELLARAYVSQSIMELGQKHINFGTLDKTARHTKKIVIRNKSETSLLYSIRKSGSIASGDIVFSEGQKGVVRGYAKKEVEFLFDPSLAGLFQEKLTIENVLNPSNDQHLIVKANIRQKATFNIESMNLSFGACLIDEISPVFQTIVVSNPSSKATRMIEVRIDNEELKFRNCVCEVWFSLESQEQNEEPMVLLSNEAEEKIEQLEQKLKIAVRKGKIEKAKNIKEQLNLFKTGRTTFELKVDDGNFSNADLIPSKDPAALKVKTTVDSIIVPIGPRSVKSIRVYFRALFTQGPGEHSNATSAISIPEGADFSRVDGDDFEACIIPIHVHEQKNTDAVKTVMLQATVCYDNATYLHCLEEFDTLRPSSSSAAIIPSFPAPAASEVIIPKKDNLCIELPIIDLGRLELNESKDCYFTLSNLGAEEAPYDIQLTLGSTSIVTFSDPLSGKVPGNEMQKIQLQIKPKKHGRDLILISVLSHQGSFCIPVRFVFFGVLPSYLNFSISDSAVMVASEGKSLELDFQYCYVEQGKKYAKVVPIKVDNTSDYICLVSATSNLALQCLLFRDAALEFLITSEGILLGPLESSVVYIALQPGLVVNNNSRKQSERILNTDGDPRNSSDFRTLIGGVRFNVFVNDCDNKVLPLSSKVPISPDGNVLVHTHSLKFTAKIGQSILETSLSSIDFGSSFDKSTWSGGFWIYNGTQKMPLDFVLESSNPSNLVFENSNGTIAPSENISSTDSERQGVWISFKLTASKDGYIHETISCINLNNCGHKCVIHVNAFVDPNVLSINPPIETLTWDDIYITENFALQKRDTDGIINRLDLSIDVENQTDELINIQAVSNFDISLQWVVTAGSGFVFSVDALSNQGDEEIKIQSIRPVSSKLLLRPRQKAVAIVSLPKPGPFMDEQNAALVFKGSKLMLNGILLLRNIDSETDLKAFSIAASYCLSMGVIEPLQVDLGKVGHFNFWKDLNFQTVLENLSQIPLEYEIEMPDCIIAVEQQKNVIPNQSVQKAEFIFKPSHMESLGKSGPQNLVIKFINLNNLENIMNFILKFNMTQFELQFDRLQFGEIILPPLTHPSPLNALPCDNWISITNVSDHDVKFDVGCTLTPDVDGLVIIEIFSRQSNTPLNSVSLVAKAVTELKLRISAVESSKLSAIKSNSSYLTNQDGITLGSLWISSKNQGKSHQDGPRIESIPIRGVLIEGKSFEISEKQLFFKSIIDSDDDDEAPKTVMLVEQKQSVLITNLSSVLPLSLSVHIEYPIEFANSEALFELSPLDKNMETEIEPGGAFTLSIALKKSSVYGLSEDIKVLLTDKNSLTKKSQCLAIKFVEDMTGLLSKSPKRELAEENPLLIFDRINASPVNEEINEKAIPLELLSSDTLSKSVIDLKGCKKAYGLIIGDFEGFFELELGQHDLSATSLVKKLTLGVVGSNSIPYRIYSMGETDASWMSINRPDGIIEPIRNSMNSIHTANHIIITFNLTVRGVWSSYLIVENLENRLDTKFIRVTLEVVAKHNIRRTVTTHSNALDIAKIPADNNRVFDVSTHALDWMEDVFDVGPVSFGTFYVARSIVIWNREIVPLDFYISSNLSRDDESELIFSLSRTSAKLFTSVRIEPESHCQIFLRYLFNPPPNQHPSEDYIENKEFEIYVNCRIVKDHQKVIKFKAQCFFPQLVVGETDYLFCGTTEKSQITVKGSNDYLVLTNPCDSLAEYQIVSDSLYFGMELVDPNGLETQQETSKLFQINSPVLLSEEPPDLLLMDDDGQFPNNPLIWVASTASSRTFSIKPKASQKFKIVPILENIEKHIDQLKKMKYVQDHFVVYNKKRLHEKERIYIRLSFGHLKGFQFASDSIKHFLIVESQGVGFLHQMAISPQALLNADLVSSDIRFLYRYLIDELVHFGTREQALHRYVQLAGLLFKMLFSKHVSNIPSTLNNKNEKPLNIDKQWVDPFIYFLGFFPNRTSHLDSLISVAVKLLR